MSNRFSLNGKNALVIGGTKGIGKGIAEGLGEAGANLIITSRHIDDCTRIAKEISEKFDCLAFGFSCDVQSLDSIKQLIKAIETEVGNIDIVVNSAGINVRKDSVDFTVKEWDLVQDIQLKGTFFTCQQVAKHMIKNKIKGKIINISSIDHKVVSRPNIIAYMAAKGAVAQMTRALAVEWAEYGICVNAIAPGYFETEMTKVLFQDETIRYNLFSHIPQKNFGDSYRDLSGLAVYFASEVSDYTTGQIVCVDGGYTLV